MVILSDKPLEQPAKALTEDQVDHQDVEPAGQGGDGQTELLTAGEG